ncbi:HipA family kinase [Idiomarina piscisalsi]|uniref:HipA-like kinase domain-containing protein n=1 Tax=Idiomarina piscisalsi TaxID=1096243 RepID=A0A432YHJ2_9GAMM|nr:HipA family kinase [Idiomarina piscisalsi]RUO60375.1 hypothetical protein CWI73_12110 [Idiomarina piscisalsi]
METVDVGLMLPGAQPFHDENINPTWKAHVKTHDSVIVAYVKRLSLRALYVECLCATIGRVLELPIPKPVIVKVTSTNISDMPDGKFELAFGSEDAGYPSFRRFVTNKEALDKLASLDETIDIGVFDEWIANWDRNVGNILYDGGNKFSFIDHENALDPRVNSEQPANDNQLIRVLYSGKSEFEKHQIMKSFASKTLPSYECIQLPLIAQQTYANSYLSKDEINKVIEFLEDRTVHVESLLSKRLGIKQQEMPL